MVQKNRDIRMGFREDSRSDRDKDREDREERDIREHNKLLGKCRKMYKVSETCSKVSKWGLLLSIGVYIIGLGFSIATDRVYNKSRELREKPYARN
jgi:hypothetical protein